MKVFSFPKFSVCQDSFVIFFMFLQLILSDDSLLNRSSQVLEEFILLKKLELATAFNIQAFISSGIEHVQSQSLLEKLILSIS